MYNNKYSLWHGAMNFSGTKVGVSLIWYLKLAGYYFCMKTGFEFQPSIIGWEYNQGAKCLPLAKIYSL